MIDMMNNFEKLLQKAETVAGGKDPKFLGGEREAVRSLIVDCVFLGDVYPTSLKHSLPAGAQTKAKHKGLKVLTDQELAQLLLDWKALDALAEFVQGKDVSEAWLDELALQGDKLLAADKVDVDACLARIEKKVKAEVMEKIIVIQPNLSSSEAGSAPAPHTSSSSSNVYGFPQFSPNQSVEFIAIAKCDGTYELLPGEGTEVRRAAGLGTTQQSNARTQFQATSAIWQGVTFYLAEHEDDLVVVCEHGTDDLVLLLNMRCNQLVFPRDTVVRELRFSLKSLVQSDSGDTLRLVHRSTVRSVSNNLLASTLTGNEGIVFAANLLSYLASNPSQPDRESLASLDRFSERLTGLLERGDAGTVSALTCIMHRVEPMVTKFPELTKRLVGLIRLSRTRLRQG